MANMRSSSIEKCDANTEWVAQQLAEFAGVAPLAVGYSGLEGSPRDHPPDVFGALAGPRRSGLDGARQFRVSRVSRRTPACAQAQARRASRQPLSHPPARCARAIASDAERASTSMRRTRRAELFRRTALRSRRRQPRTRARAVRRRAHAAQRNAASPCRRRDPQSVQSRCSTERVSGRHLEPALDGDVWMLAGTPFDLRTGGIGRHACAAPGRPRHRPDRAAAGDGASCAARRELRELECGVAAANADSRRALRRRTGAGTALPAPSRRKRLRTWTRTARSDSPRSRCLRALR